MHGRNLCPLIIFLIVLGLCGCGNRCENNAEQFLSVAGISHISDINQTLQMRTPNSIQTRFKASEFVTVEVLITGLEQPLLQKTNESMLFYLYDKVGCEWLKVEEAGVRLNEQFIIQPDPTYDVITIGSTGLPTLDNINEVTILRVLRIGRLIDYSGNEIETIAAYVDIEVEP